MSGKLFTLITGASDGLGKALAFECAARQFPLVLVALPDGRLEKLAAYLRSNFAVDVYSFESDLSQPEDCRKLFLQIRAAGLTINTLINNAGVGGTCWFYESDIARLETQIRLNVLATTLLSRLFIDELAGCRVGYLLNVSSLGCFFYLPRKNVYSGTKCFIYFLSRSLRAEMRNKGVSVSVLCPGGIDSNPSAALLNRSGTWFARQSVMSPEKVARAAISGMLKRKRERVPGKWNRLFLVIRKICPGILARYLMQKQMARLQPAEFIPAAALSSLRTG